MTVHDDQDLDDFPSRVRGFAAALGRQQVKTTKSRANVERVRDIHDEWLRKHRPQLVSALGEHPAIQAVDEELQQLRIRSGATLEVKELKRSLRAVAKAVDSELLPDYTTARYTEAATVADERQRSDPREDPLVRRVADLNGPAGESLAQALLDVADRGRVTYIGPAGEIREVVRTVIHQLSPEDDVMGQAWFKGYEGRPTQAERIRYIMQQKSTDRTVAVHAAELVDTKVGALGRSVYGRASSALHARAQRAEVEKIVQYSKALLLDILPEDEAPD